MGQVTQKLIELLNKQIAEQGTVVWYDPDDHYQEVVADLTHDQLGGAQIFYYRPTEGFFDLRYRLESHWAVPELPKAPKLLIYVPLAQAATHYALIEYEVGGVVMQPNQQPPECNTALAAVARQALTSIFPPARVELIVNEAQAGKLNLAELDQLAERGTQSQTGTLAVIFGTGNVTDVVLIFLSQSKPDLEETIRRRKALSDITDLLSQTLGVSFRQAKDSADLRRRAARQILLTDFVMALGENLPDGLRTIALASEPAARQAAVDLAQQWRNRRDIAATYAELARQIGDELGIPSLGIPLEKLAQSETFLAGELHLQHLVEESLINRPSTALIELMSKRLNGFWSIQEPYCRTRWEVIFNAGRVLQEANRIESGLKGKPWSASKLFAEYVYGDNPWCGLDTAQRHLERDIYRYDLSLQDHDSLQRLIALASQKYTATIHRLAELFVGAYKDEGFELPNVQMQTDIYRDFVEPRVKSKRVAYILIDAFRFEMAREFYQMVRSGELGWGSELTPVLATPPTITDVGMAALMPGAEHGLHLVRERGNLVPYIEGKALRTAKARWERIKLALGQDIAVVTLDDIAPLRVAKTRKALENVPLALVTASDEIDGLGENNPQKARRSMDEIFNLLRRGLSALFSVGFEEAIITADHGFILASRLEDGQKIDSLGGQELILKRRVWIGRGGANHDAVLRTPLSAFGISGDLELATPIGLAAFKVQGGNMEYFHGGLALQELVIPALVISAGSTQPIVASSFSSFDWSLKLGSQKITSPYVSVMVEGVSKELLVSNPPMVRVEIRERERTLAVPVAAGYGFQDTTRDVKLSVGESPHQIQANTIVVFLSEKPEAHSVDIHLLDASTGMSLKSMKAEVDLTLFD